MVLLLFLVVGSLYNVLDHSTQHVERMNVDTFLLLHRKARHTLWSASPLHSRKKIGVVNHVNPAYLMIQASSPCNNTCLLSY